MTPHDGSYKHIFSHPQIVCDLLTGFVREPWVEQLDLGTLELTNGSYVSDDLRGRADDVVWRVRTRHGEQWLYVYLLIEFQSRVDPWMALRILVYTGLLYQDLVKSEQVRPGDRLPPVFPMVVYNGEGVWRARREMAELIEPVAGLKAYCPRQKHVVLDEGRLSDDEIAAGESTLAEMIRLERTPTPQELQAIVSRLTRRLNHPRYDSLRRALVVWLNRVVLKRLMPGER
ncbi:Rpn family recombination-promoting nuclease/putative transposase, partial [Rhodocyclaceae bacterium SMB388]